MEAENSNSYDSSSDEEIPVRLNKFEKQISILSSVNHKQIIKNLKKYLKTSIMNLIKKKKK